jgi:hypothetical protein
MEVLMSGQTPEDYKADGGFSATGLPILFAALFAGAIGLGWLVSLISQKFYLILLFPVGIGVALIGVGRLVGRATKMRNTAVAVALGAISSCAAMLSMHYFDYQRFLGEREELLKDAGPLIDNPQIAVDPEVAAGVKFLKQSRAVDSFPSYMEFEATQGVTIGSRGRGHNLGYVGTWIYWVVELVIVAILTTIGLVAGAAEPFCSTCNTWKKSRQLGTLVGSDYKVVELLRSGEIQKLNDHDPAPNGGDLVLTVAACPNCQTNSPIAIKVEEMTTNSKGEVSKTKRAHLVLAGETLTEFEKLFAWKPKAPKPTEEKPSEATDGT